MADEIQEIVLLVFYLRSTQPMVLKIPKNFVDNFIKSHVIPGMQRREGIIALRYPDAPIDSEKFCIAICASEVIGFQISELPESEKWKQ